MSTYPSSSDWRTRIAAVALLWLVGCADNGMVTISGEISFEGEPVADGTIGFFPVDGLGPSAEAVVIDGKYSVSLTRGAKTVVIEAFRKVGEHYPWGKEAPPAPIFEEILPDEFQNNSKLSVEIDASRDDINFELSAS